MKRLMKRLCAGAVAATVMAGLWCCSCTQVPITGRRQLDLVSHQDLHTMSYKEYGDFVRTHPLSTDTGKVEMVRRVGRRIQTAVETYFAQNGLSARLDGYAWEFNLVESKEVNAWCMPGGKVVVYTGILPIAEDETGLAVVLGHEIAHAVANHSAERMSQALIAQLGIGAVGEAMTKYPKQTRDVFLKTVGLGATVGVMLPYSRLQENEADRLGLVFMAMAGYNPNSAVAFWERMAKGETGARPPEFLSTHPAPATRIANIKRLVQEEAVLYYKPQAR